MAAALNVQNQSVAATYMAVARQANELSATSHHPHPSMAGLIMLRQ